MATIISFFTARYTTPEILLPKIVDVPACADSLNRYLCHGFDPWPRVETCNFDPCNLTCDDINLRCCWRQQTLEKKKKSFYFPLNAFLFYLQYSKKKKFQFWISNFEFENSKIQKKKFVEKTGIDQRENHLWDIYFLMSRDRAKPSSHWAEIPSQDHFKIQASKPRSELSSHVPTKPSRDLLQAKIQATEPRSEPSSRDTSQAKLSQDIWTIIL